MAQRQPSSRGGKASAETATSFVKPRGVRGKYLGWRRRRGVFHSEIYGRPAARLAVAARHGYLHAHRLAVRPPRPSRMVNRSAVQVAVDAGSGILRLEPAWVPRTF